jgi:hypothetical protein
MNSNKCDLCKVGHVIAQRERRWPLTAVPRVRSQFGSCEICDGRVGTGAGFSQEFLRLFPANHRSTIGPYSSITAPFFVRVLTGSTLSNSQL